MQVQINPTHLREFLRIAKAQADEHGLDVKSPTARTAFNATIGGVLVASFPDPLVELVEEMIADNPHLVPDVDSEESEMMDSETESNDAEFVLGPHDGPADYFEATEELQEALEELDAAEDAGFVLAELVVDKILTADQRKWAEDIVASKNLRSIWVKKQVRTELIDLKLIEVDDDAEYVEDWGYDFTPAGVTVLDVFAERAGIQWVDDLESDDLDDEETDGD